MTLSTAGYTVGANRPLTCARILWSPIQGAITADGTGGDLAANDFTNQRWQCGSLPANWTLDTAANASVDTIFIAAHNLAGRTVAIQTASTAGGAFTTRATVVVADSSAIAVMINNAGVPYVVRRIRVVVSGTGTDAQIGIIRAGVALQMQRPVYGGVKPIRLNRKVETRHQVTETGQWVGRTFQRVSMESAVDWPYLTASWYLSTFDPFAQQLPRIPFGLIQNPLRMPESVAWCWTDDVPEPEYMGVLDYMQVSLKFTGFAG